MILRNHNSARDWLWPFTKFKCSTVLARAVSHHVRRTHASHMAGSISELQRMWQHKHVRRVDHSECRAMYTCVQLTHNFAESHIFNDRTSVFLGEISGRICVISWWKCIAASWMDDMESERKEAFVLFFRWQTGSAWTKAKVDHVNPYLLSLTLRFACHDKIYASWRDSKEHVSGCKLHMPLWYRWVCTLKVKRRYGFQRNIVSNWMQSSLVLFGIVWLCSVPGV